MRYRYQIIILFLSLLISKTIHAQSDANITGHVISNGVHIPGITIILKGTLLGTATDHTGHYQLRNLPEGEYTLRAQGIGFISEEKSVSLNKGKTIEVNFELAPDQIQLDQVVVSANRNETSRRDAPIIVNVLTPKLFENTQSSSLAGGLNFQTGLRVESSCQNCGFPQVRINGLEGPYSQILIDSRPMFSALNGVYGLEHIPASMIERVEVVRGGGSAIYGSNAVAGTINIITREPLTNSFLMDYSIQGYSKNSIGHNFNMNSSQVSDDNQSGLVTYAMFRKQDPWDANNDGFSEIGKNQAGAFGLRSFLNIGSNNKLTLELHYINEERRGGDNFTLQPHESNICEMARHNITGLALSWKHFSKDNKGYFNLYSSTQYTDRNSYYGAEKNPDAYGRTSDFILVNGLQYTRNHNLLFAPGTLTVGAEHNFNELKDAMPGYNRSIDQEVNIIGAFAQNEWKTEHMTILAGVRADKHNLLDNIVISPRLTFKYDFDNILQTRMSFGTGYRAPQAYDEDLHIAAVGGEVHLISLADDLGPERSYTISFSGDLYNNSKEMPANLLAEVFYTHLSDVFILEEKGLTPQGNVILERRNGPGATVKGINLEGKLIPAKAISLQAGFTFQKNNYEEPVYWSDKEGAEPATKMMRSPETYGYFTFTASPVKSLNLALTGTYTGTMDVPHYLADGHDRLEKTPNFFDAGFKVSINAVKFAGLTAEFYGGVKNVFNSIQSDFDSGVYRDSKYIYGPREPRTIFFGVKINRGS